MDKRFLAILGVIIAVFIGAAVLQSSKKPGTNTGGSTQATNHVEGNLTSKVTLVEYGDYECPACESFHTTLQSVQQKYNDSVKFQFRNLPLRSLHPNAIAGARAAEAADLQGKFWQMHDTLYAATNWQQWSTSSNPAPYFWQYAQTLGLNVSKFKTDFASSTTNDRINADLAAFAKTGKDQATPTFFLNGTYVNNNQLLGADGQPSAAAFTKLLDTALKIVK
jgi:protein-disulfide isomerase